MNLKDLKKELIKDPNFKKEWNKQDLAFDISEALIRLRIEKGLSQGKLAKKIKSKQSAIARAENGNYLPSLRWLEKVAKATKSKIIFKFENIKKNKK